MREEIMDRKRATIVAGVSAIEDRLDRAREYVARNVNVEGKKFLHIDDWQGRSGHPKWMKNFMIPTMMKRLTTKRRILKQYDNRTKDKKITLRKRLSHTQKTEHIGLRESD
jgi:hypothetical protein